MHIKTSGLFQVFQNLVSHQKYQRDINRFHVLLNVFIWFGKLPAHGAKYPSILSNYECRAPANTTRSKCSKKKKKKKKEEFLADEKHENKNHSEATVVMN